MYKKLRLATTLLCFFGLSGYAHAITVNFDFTGECDDCAFAGNPGDPGFNPLNDGLTETVTARLSIDGLSVDNGMIDYRGAGNVTFTYNGSSLVNSFAMADPYTFSTGLLTTGAVADGFEFRLSSTQNYTDPNNPISFDFPNFCTGLGEQVLGFGDCNFVGDITFLLDSNGNWSISGMGAADIGTNGQFAVSTVPVPGAVILFASGLIGLVGFTRRRTA